MDADESFDYQTKGKGLATVGEVLIETSASVGDGIEATRDPLDDSQGQGLESDTD